MDTTTKGQTLNGSPQSENHPAGNPRDRYILRMSPLKGKRVEVYDLVFGKDIGHFATEQEADELITRLLAQDSPALSEPA